MHSSSQANDLFPGINTNAPRDFTSYLAMKKNIETRLSELKNQHANNPNLIIGVERQAQTLFINLKINFIKKMSASGDQMSDLLFGSLTSQDQIKQRFRELSIEFHPDKCSDLNAESTNTFYQAILGIKENLLYNLSDESKKFTAQKSKKPTSSQEWFYPPPDEKSIYPEEEVALKSWKIAIEYQNALKGVLQFEYLQWEEIIDLTLSDNRLIELRKQAAMKAYEQYKIACNHADRDHDIYKRISLRKSMAMSLYLADVLDHAQLYTLGTMNLLLDNAMSFSNSVMTGFFGQDKPMLPNQYTLSVLDELQALLKKISNKSILLKKTPLAQENPIVDSRTLAFLANKNLNLDYDWIKQLVRHDLMSFFPDISFILNEKECRDALTPIEVVKNPSFLRSFADFFGNQKINNPTNSKLKEIFCNALNYYYRNKYHEFLQTISAKIPVNDAKETLQLFKYGELTSSDFKKVAHLMLDYGYKPDGIACLVSLISNAVHNLEQGYKQTTLSDLQFSSSQLTRTLLFDKDLVKNGTNMQEKFALLSKIEAIRLLMRNTMGGGPRNETNGVLCFFTEAVSGQEKIPLVHQKWYSDVITLMDHYVMACGLSLSISINLKSENTAKIKSSAPEEFKKLGLH